jgi:hypothetical protein
MMEPSTPIIIAGFGLAICGFLLLSGGGIKQIQSGKPSRLQSGSMIGFGAAAACIGLMLTNRILLTIVFIAFGMVAIAAGVVFLRSSQH